MNDITYLPNPDDPQVIDIHMWVGREYYTVGAYVKESMAMGISKRVSIKSIPDGIKPLKSRIFVSAPEAILEVTAEGLTLHDLVKALFDRGTMSADQLIELLESMPEHFWNTTDGGLRPGDFVPDGMLQLVCVLDEREEIDRGSIIKEFGIVFHPGVFGYGYISDVEYVCKDNEEDLPPELAHMADLIVPVKVIYEDEE